MITDREEAGELSAEPGPAASRRCLGPNCPTAGSETWACGEKWALCLGRKGQNHISENNTSKKSCISAMQCCFLQCCRNISPAASADHHLVVQYQTELTAKKKMSFPQSRQPPESTQAEGTRGSSLQAHQQQQPPGLPGPCSGWVGSEHTTGDNSCTCFLKVLKKTAEWLRFWVGIRRKTVLFCLFPKKEKKFLKNVFELLV